MQLTAAVRELPNTQIGIRIMEEMIFFIKHHPFPLKSRLPGDSILQTGTKNIKSGYPDRKEQQCLKM